MKKYITVWVLTAVLFAAASCKKYLDVIPDNVPTIDNAFAMRNEAQKYLFTCYSYMPEDGNVSDPALFAGDEIWRQESRASSIFNIARGFQSVVNNYGGQWDNLYKGLRDCNIFLENIGRVPDIDEPERQRWIAEVKFLKAYYHFYLLRMYGPIPLVKENIPIDATTEQVQVARDPVDSCFSYIEQLIDEAEPHLPFSITDPGSESGRITQPIALSFKALVRVTAASPLFNGNNDQASLKNPDGTPLFNTTYSKVKWDSAVVACKRAIDMCHEAGIELYENGPRYQQYELTDTISTQLSIRNSFAQRWNSEIIWGNTQSFRNDIQELAIPQMDFGHSENYRPRGELSPPLKIAAMFYSQHGVPIEEDKTWDYAHRNDLKIAEDKDALYIHKGYTTAAFNFDREPRFYADMGFDGSVWYGQGFYDDSKPEDLLYVQARFGNSAGMRTDRESITGYFIKKFVHFENVVGAGTALSITTYPWPVMRLSDLYLLYAEALNEAQGPGEEVYQYLNLVRQRAGLPTVQDAWDNYSNNPTKYTSEQGLRDIIHQERLIELAFEGKRFWDLRRWKEAAQVMNAPIQSWDMMQEIPANYYRVLTIFNQSFGTKDYFWPISEGELSVNPKLVQNIGW